MVARVQVAKYTVEEAASFLNRASWFVAGAIARGDLVPDADGRLTRAALLAFVEEEARRSAALREAMAESEDAGLDATGTRAHLAELGIIDSEEGGACDR